MQGHRQVGNWGFYQLREVVVYKAKLAGVLVVFVDPAYTSQTCSRCGHCETSNRQSQDRFCCLHCGYSANADYNAALNLRAKALGPRCKLASRVATRKG